LRHPTSARLAVQNSFAFYCEQCRFIHVVDRLILLPGNYPQHEQV